MSISGSIRTNLYIILLLSLLPITALLIFSSVKTRQDTTQALLQEANIKLHLLDIQQSTIFASAYIQLTSLGQRDEVLKHNVPQIQKLLDNILQHNTAYNNIYVSDENGNVLASAHGFIPGTSIKDTAFFQAAINSRTLVSGSFRQDPFTGSLAIPLARRAVDENGKVTALVVASLSEVIQPDYVEDLLGKADIRLTVVDREGTIVLATPQGEKAPGESCPDWEALRAQSSESGFFYSATQKKEKTINYFKRVYILGSDEQVQNQPILTLHLIQSAKMAYSASNTLIYRNFALMALAILAALSIIWMLGHTNILKSVNTLLNVAARISTGQAGVRTPSTDMTGDFVKLAQALDNMAEGQEKRKQALVKARNEALASNRAKNEFLANMSHGIRTPMNSIIGMAYLILKTDLSPKQKVYLDKIYSAANNLLGIINDILDFSKITAGQFSMEEAPFSIDELMDNISGIIYQKAEEKGLSMNFSVSPDMPAMLIGDQLRIGQILTNLIGNAVKFTETGGISIKCRLLEKSGEKVKLSFLVSDTGIGMSEQQIESLFQAFAQADGSTTRKFGGTGLGLTISKRLVELMGGDIIVKSEVGVGSNITVTIWLRAQEDNEEEIAEISKTFAGFPVLLIDDNKEYNQIFAKQLKDLGLRVDLAQSPEEGLERLESMRHGAQYSIVFIELLMEEVDGAAVTLRILGQFQSNQTPPIVITTSSPYSPEVAAYCEESGALGIIHKPMTRKTLVKTLNDIFTGKMKNIAQNLSGPVKMPKMNPLRGLHLLLVEDNPINQQVAVELLHDTQALVKVASNGVDAIAMLEESMQAGEPYDMLLLDLQMPQMDGYEVARIIRQDERHNTMPIIAMTAHAMAEEKQKCLDYGMNDHIAKPLEMQKFYDTLLHWAMKKKRPANAAGTIDKKMPERQKKNDNDATAIAPESKANVKIEHEREQAEELLSAIPGLDSESALKRLGGNKSLYKKLLTQFVEFYKNMENEYQESAKAEDIETCTRIAHTLKGLAGSIGAIELSKAAEELETALNKTQPHAKLAKYCFELLAEVQSVLGGILHLNGKEVHNIEEDGNEQTELCLSDETEEAKKYLEKLLEFLHDDDAEATAFFEEHKNQLSCLFSRQRLAALQNVLSRFEFDEALNIIDAESKDGIVT